MSDVKWIKITTDIFDDEKLLLIETMLDADAIIVIWFKLLVLAGKQNNHGVIMMSDRIAYTDEMLASIFRRPLSTVRLALGIFEQYGMIEIIEGVITIPNWEKHQSLDQLEQRREYMKNYMKKKRQEQKNLITGECKVNSKVNVNSADKNKNKNKKENIYTDMPDELISALKDFEDMRKRIKSPLSDRAKQMLLTKLDKLAGDDTEKKIAILEQSIFNSWKGVFEIDDRRSDQKRSRISGTTGTSSSGDKRTGTRLPSVASELLADK
jgi:predicted phage replisome organizer